MKECGNCKGTCEGVEHTPFCPHGGDVSGDLRRFAETCEHYEMCHCFQESET